MAIFKDPLNHPIRGFKLASPQPDLESWLPATAHEGDRWQKPLQGSWFRLRRSPDTASDPLGWPVCGHALTNLLRLSSSPRTAWPFQRGCPSGVSDGFAVFIVYFIKWWANHIVSRLSQNWKALRSVLFCNLSSQVSKRKLWQAVVHLKCQPGVQVTRAQGSVT